MSRKRARKKYAPILQPSCVFKQTEENDTCGFIWPCLHTKASLVAPGAGDGLFATSNLHAGVKIPLLGRPIGHEELETLEARNADTHIVAISGKSHSYLDGNPSFEPFCGIGGRGLYIAMMANEPCRGKPNCVFRGNFLQVAMDVAAGEELTISYGKSYRRSGYRPSSYCFRKCSYPKLLKFK